MYTFRTSSSDRMGCSSRSNSDGWRFDSDARGKLAKFLNVPDRYLKRCADEAPDLVATNLNYWLEHNPGDVALYTAGDNIVNIVDPESNTLPASTYINITAGAFEPNR